MIRYLNQDEYRKCIPLWREAFPEDSEEFVKYYFDRKIMGSRVIVKENNAGRILSMAHLGPYRVAVGSWEFELPYIVGVATAADCRHQGHMRDLLVKLLGDLHHARLPFCYLMPASPDIYLPFGFMYIYDQPVWRLREDLGKEAVSAGLRLEEQEELGAWINRWLRERYQVYAKRDREYLKLLQAELDSENGQVTGYRDSMGGLAALEAVWGIDKREQRFLYCGRQDWLAGADETAPAKPAVMARITDAAAMAQVITVNQDCPCARMEVFVKIKDRLIPGNNGLWRWSLGTEGSSLRPEGIGGISGGETSTKERPDQNMLVSTEVLEITVEQMTAWLFGYRTLDEIMEEDGGTPPFWWQYVKPLQGVFLDEVV